jgi:hypothetical protein
MIFILLKLTGQQSVPDNYRIQGNYQELDATTLIDQWGLNITFT